MSQKLIKITCNLTGKTMAIYEDYYDKKVVQYGGEEALKKFYIQNKLINLIKAGHDISDIATSMKFELNNDKLDYYKELIEFHRGSAFSIVKEECTQTISTDPDVMDFINRWISYGK